MTKLHIIHRSAMTQMLIIAAKAIKNEADPKGIF